MCKNNLQCCSVELCCRSGEELAPIVTLQVLEWCLCLFLKATLRWHFSKTEQLGVFTKWAGWAFLTISCLNPGPYRRLQDFFLILPLNQTLPACSHLLTLILVALWACLWLSSPSRSVPSCTHTHTDAQTHSHIYTLPQSTPLLQSWVTALGPGDLRTSKLSLLTVPPCQTPKQRFWTHPHFYFSTPHFSVSVSI